LYNKYPSHPSYYTQYYKTLIALKQYDDAVKTVRKQQKKTPQDLTLYVDLGQAYEADGKPKDANQAYDEALKKLNPDFQALQRLANAFLGANQPNRALAVYEQARKVLGDGSAFADEIAALYAARNDAAGYVKTYLDLIDAQPSTLPHVQMRLQDRIDDAPVANELQTQLYKRIQKQSDDLTSAQLLVWFFTQRKDFENALVQAKAIDRRAKEDGNRVYQLAQAAFEEGQYDLANDAFQYVVDKGANTPLYMPSRTEQLNVLKTRLVVSKNPTPQQLTEADLKYKAFLEECGRTASTVSVVRDHAMLEARFLQRVDSAIAHLEQIIRVPGANKKLLANCKLDLGDYYLITGNVWDTQLYYSQVDKDFKEEPLAALARFKNAKLSFYKGEFEWSQAQLDIIKGATTELISNDAINLSVFITDNMGLDSNTTPLGIFARADLLLFQHRFADAVQTLDTLLTEYPEHPLKDDALFEKALINIQRKDFQAAADFLKSLDKEHGTDLLGDNALFTLAELYEHNLNHKNQAMELYKEILTRYPGSLYVIEARKRFRTLRGDAL
ncbi:MAG TPA: tetratricopeptide repeat protein, partial [Chitinophagales bacterium]|nr:tetratricopeptide repeat protein [Chitinophagales bacterium]